MSRIRVGTSWRGQRPGQRYWVSMPLSSLMLGWAAIAFFWLCAWPFILAFWLLAEVLVLLASLADIAILAAQHKRMRWRETVFVRLRFGLWALVVPWSE